MTVRFVAMPASLPTSGANGLSANASPQQRRAAAMPSTEQSRSDDRDRRSDTTAPLRDAISFAPLAASVRAMDAAAIESRFDRIDGGLEVLGMAVRVISGAQRIQTERLDLIIQMLTPKPGGISVVDVLSQILAQLDEQTRALGAISEGMAKMRRELPLDTARAIDDNRRG